MTEPPRDRVTSADTMACPFCEAEIGARANKCRFCGEWVSRSCEGCGTPVRAQWAARGLCAECQKRPAMPATAHVPTAVPVRKSRTVATITALLFGGIGAHRFYLGNPLAGFVYLVFCWTFIPALLGMFEGLRYALMDDVDFQARYSG